MNHGCLVQDKQRLRGPNNKGFVTYKAARNLYATRATGAISNGRGSSSGVETVTAQEGGAQEEACV